MILEISIECSEPCLINLIKVSLPLVELSESGLIKFIKI